MAHDRDIVGGIYPQKTLPPKMVVNTLNNGKREGDLVEVGTMGTGFMMIKRVVFEAMIDQGAQKYTDAIGLSNEENNHQFDFFNCTIDSQGRYLTEDWSFCRRWRELGGQIWADTTIPLVHVGYHRFYPNMEQINGNN